MKYSCKPQVTNLDLPKMAIYKDIVTLQISVYYWRVVFVQINEPLQDLACPAFDSSDIDSPIFLPISAEGIRLLFLECTYIVVKPIESC